MLKKNGKKKEKGKTWYLLIFTVYGLTVIRKGSHFLFLSFYEYHFFTVRELSQTSLTRA